MPLRSGVTLKVAWPTIDRLLRFSAVKYTSFCSPRCTVTARWSGTKRQGKPGATLVSNATVMVCLETLAVSAATR